MGDSESTRLPPPYLGNILAAVADCVYCCDPAGRVLYANRALRGLWRDYSHRFDGQDRGSGRLVDVFPWHETRLRQVIATGEPLQAEDTVVGADPELRYLHRLTPVFTEDGDLEAITGVARRITGDAPERRTREEGETRLRVALETAGVGVWEFDFATGRVIADRRFRDIHGLPGSIDPLEPLRRLERVHPENRSRVETALRRVCDPTSGDSGYTTEYRVVAADGSERWVRDHARVFFEGRGAARRPFRITGTTHDITERKRLEHRFHRGAFHDALTDLPNRALIMERLGQMAAGGTRGGRSAAVLMLDIDNFKLINDSFGHAAGDRVLTGFARLIRRYLRPEDTLARMGGDEFCVLIEAVEDRQCVIRVVERVQWRLRKKPFLLHGHEIPVRVSAGIAFAGTDHRRPETMMQDADVALYEAKRRGKNNYVLFDQGMRQGARSFLRLERALQHAVANGKLSVKYQPIVELPGGAMVGCEALARWYRSPYGWVEPAQFIPAAEQAGIILPLGELVLETACREFARWTREQPARKGFYVAVNLSSQQLAQSDLVEQVIHTLDRHGLQGHNLRLELTESSIVENGEHAVQVIGALQARGVRVCMDDFGVGYSSLSYLQRFPVSVLKLDQSFVQGLTGGGPTTLAIVKTVLDLATNLGLEAIAEGAERAEQREILGKLGFTRAQGFLFHRPLATETMAELVAATRL